MVGAVVVSATGVVVAHGWHDPDYLARRCEQVHVVRAAVSGDSLDEAAQGTGGAACGYRGAPRP